MTEVAWMLFLISSFPLLRSSAARMTTEVVPSPTSLSWIWESSTKTLAAGWVTYLELLEDCGAIVGNGNITNVVNQHLIETLWTEGGLHNV